MTNVASETVSDVSDNQVKDSPEPVTELSESTEVLLKKDMLEEIKSLKKDVTSNFTHVKGRPSDQSESVSAIGNLENMKQEKISDSVKQLFDLYSKKRGKWPPVFNQEKKLSWPSLTGDHNSIRLDVETSGSILIRIVTWNQQARPHPRRDRLRERLLTEDRYHLYVIGTQECEHSIAHSLVNQSKLQWETLLRETLGHNYEMIQSHTLQASHLIMFMHKALTPLITNISSFSVPCGLGNQLGNKGAIAISMKISSTSYLFVNSHLASGQGAYQLRNLNYHRIQTQLIKLIQQERTTQRKGSQKESKLEINDRRKVYPLENTDSTKVTVGEEVTSTVEEPTSAPPLQSGNRSSKEASYSSSYLESILQIVSKDPTIDLTSKISDYHNPKQKLIDLFDHVFWFGDFNYRVNGSVNTVSSLLKKDYHEVLQNNDQLKIAMRKKEAFHGFTEGPLNFRPTYKYKKGTDEYDSSKKHIPSWTDRILYKEDNNKLLLYAAVRELNGSDHKPVMASFRSKVTIDIAPSILTVVGNHKSEVCNIS